MDEFYLDIIPEGSIPFFELNKDNYDHDKDSENDAIIENDLSQEKDKNSLEYLLSNLQITSSDDNNKEINKNKFTLFDFIQKHLDNLKEDLIYYFSSPEILLHFKDSMDKEIKYDFYKDLFCENFLKEQKERFKLILSNIKLDSESIIKKSKLSNFNDFCSKARKNEINEQINQKIINANIIGTKLDEYLYSIF